MPLKQQAYQEEDKALPQPVLVKRMILKSREEARNQLVKLQEEPNQREFRRYKNKLTKFYQDIEVYARRRNQHTDQLKQLRKISLGKQKDELDVEDWMEYFYDLNELLYELGITDIGVGEKKYEFGYDFLDGLAFELEAKKLGWQRLQANINHMCELLRKDTDFFIVITGAGNRVGKSTLGLHLLNTAIGADDITEQHLVFTDDDFWTATNELPQYAWFLIDELTDHFYSKNAMKGEQKQKKQKLNNAAANNMAIVGCTPSFYDIDKEVINKKVTANIHIPTRGQFEFYTKRQVQEEFSKNKDDGSADRPTPAFSGKFDALGGELWNLYKDVEEKKLDSMEEEAKGELNVTQVAQEVKQKQERYKKEYNGRTYIDQELIEADYESIGGRKSKQVKKKVESDLGLN